MCSIYILQSHQCNQNQHIDGGTTLMFIFCSTVTFQKTMPRPKLWKTLTLVFQPVCSHEPVSPKIQLSLPQSSRQALDFTCRCWCESLSAVHAKGSELKEERCRRLSIRALKEEEEEGSQTGEECWQWRLNKERSRIARCYVHFLLGLYHAPLSLRLIFENISIGSKNVFFLHSLSSFCMSWLHCIGLVCCDSCISDGPNAMIWSNAFVRRGIRSY